MQDSRNESSEIANDYIQTRKKYGKDSVQVKEWLIWNSEYACMTEEQMWNYFETNKEE